MSRSAAEHRGPAPASLEQRVDRLEEKVGALIEAVEVLARGLEDGRMAEVPEAHAGRAARQAHELLLLAKSARPPASEDEGT